MGYKTEGMVLGVIVVLVFSFVFTPIICNSIKQENGSISCSIYSQAEIYIRIFSNVWYYILIILGCFLGYFVGRGIEIIKKRFYSKTEVLEKKLKKKTSVWPWENK